MASSQGDLIKISAVLLKFFETKRIQDSLTKFLELGVTGWEKWWQMELAVHLADSDDVAEWEMEHPFDTDRRTSLAQSRMALDIGFRLKKHRSDAWYFVELKQHDSYRECVKRMVRDAEKVFSARKRSFDGLSVRYIACAGICADTGASREEIAYVVADQLEDAGIEGDGVIIDEIGKHHLLIIF